MKESFKKKVKDAIYEEKIDEKKGKTIRYKNQRELNENIDADVSKILSEAALKQRKYDKGIKTILGIIPIIVIAILYIVIYFMNKERFVNISLISFIFKYSLYFYVLMAIYFTYLMIMEVLYNIRINDNKIGKLFILLFLELCVMGIHIILLNTYCLYLYIFPIFISLMTLYLYIRRIIKEYNSGMGDLV